MIIPFNVPTELGAEFDYIKDAIQNRKISGNGKYTELCHAYLEKLMGRGDAFLTTSCTHALEMATLVAGIGPGDEVILPSFTFTSTANAVVLRGAIPVFVDIRPDTLNIDETLLEAAITPKTKAIMVVHYAGVGCEMDAICALAARHGLLVIEDAAQALHATYRGRQLGSIGELSAFSFHETKNIIAGEGGALMVNEPGLVGRSEILWEKGTNRVSFKRGEISRYTWVDVGSSFLPSEITAAFLFAQLEKSVDATARRLAIWQRYHDLLAPVAAEGRIALPGPPDHCGHNGHIYYVVTQSEAEREDLLARLGEHAINAVVHYVPLHSAPAGLRFGRVSGDMHVTDRMSSRLIRLPLHLQLTHGDQDRVCEAIRTWTASRTAVGH